MIKLNRRGMLSLIIKPLFGLFILCSIFTIVWLRSSLVAIEYEISNLESHKMKMQRQTRLLVAERAELLSAQRIRLVMARQGFDRLDRTRVVMMKRSSEGAPQKVANFFGTPDHWASYKR